MCEILPKYLEDPKRYCNKINSLLDQNSNEWQTVWKAAIPELSGLPSNQLSAINLLLKPIESAFKSKDSRLRVQAFECWSHFLAHCSQISVSKSEKLWNVLLVPLTAHNHSVYIVLSAKLKTWDAFIDASFQINKNALKKAIPSILKCLYGPHSLDPACNFVKQAETCGQLYLKIMKKCSTFVPEINTIFSYLEKAIPPLSNLPNTQKLAKLVWNEALKIISESGWQTEHFNYLMRTLENLFSDNKNDGVQLISNCLAILFDIHCSFPPDRLTPHMNLIIRCLFHPPVNTKMICNIMNSMLKLCENPSFCFYEVDRVLMDKTKNDRTDVDVSWIAMASCYTKWIKNELDSGNNTTEIDPSLKILLFPFQYISEISYETDRFNYVMKHWKQCYEDCVTYGGSDQIMPVLFEKLEAGIDNNIPRLIVATYMCNAILTIVKFSDGFIHMKGVLLKISKNMPDIKKLTDSKLKPFAIKYIVTVKAYVQLQKTCWEDFSYVIKTFSPLLQKDADETSKENVSKSDADSDSSSKLSNEGSCSKIATPTQKLSSFLDRLLSPVVKKADVASPGRSPSTPKTSKIDNQDIQFIEMKPKPKNSPMTQHQLEKAKSKNYIPALYQDLSQSYSQSLSQSESENLFVENKKPNTSINPELFEENANLPSTSNTTSASPIIPRSLSFHTGLNSPISQKSDKVLLTVSLLNDDKKQDGSESDSSIEVISTNETVTNTDCNEIEILDKQPTKRKNLRENETPSDVTPVKRSKRLRDRVEKSGDDKSAKGTSKFSIALESAQKSGEKSRSKNEKSTTNKVNEPEIIDLETESSNTVHVVDRVVDGVSRTSNSLMDLKNDNRKSSEKKKSLKRRGNSTPNTSITSRKHRSRLFEADSKKSTDSDDSVSDQKSTRNDENIKKRKASTLSFVNVVVNDIQPSYQIDKAFNSEILLVTATPTAIKSSKEIDTEKESIGMEKNTSNNVTSPTKSICNDSVILVDEGVPEVISIDDSESVNSKKKLDENKISSISNAGSVPAPHSSDESTFYEGSDLNIAIKEQPCIMPINENPVEENIPNDGQNATNPNPQAVQKLPISPEVISSIDSNSAVENDHVVGDCTNQREVETSEVEDVPKESSSKNENILINDEINASEEILNSGNKATTDSALLSNPNSRGYHIWKLAQGPEFSVNPSKSPKITSPKHPHRIKEKSHFPSPIASRSSRILFENNQLPSTPNHPATPTQEEIEKSIFTPKSYPRRSILKTPESKRSDVIQNISSPRSPNKRVSFADKDYIKMFHADDESDSDSLISTGDKLSNENLMNEKLQSQDMLYSPLQNCKDSIEELLGYIFSSAGSRQALKYFKSIGIDKVGQLASMSTLTASSIPAGDNRVRRMRHALKKYDQDLERKQRRRPSTRRSEFKNMNIICLKDLPLEVEPTDIENYSDEEIDTMKTVHENNKQSEEISSKEAPITLSEQPTPNEAAIDINISTAADKTDKNETENNETKDNKHLVIAPASKSEEENLEPIESETPIIVDGSMEKSGKQVETEIVKQVENKENVDPHSDIINVDTVSQIANISTCGIEPMEVDERPCDIPKTSDEVINESADYVCTDNTTYEQDVNDRRSITIRDLRQYTTVIESNNKAVPTKNPSKKMDIVTNEIDNSDNKSGSSNVENKIIPQSEKIIELQNTEVDSQETSISAIDSVIVISSVDQDQQTNTVNESVESNVDESRAEDIEQNIQNEENQLNENENVVGEDISSNYRNNDDLAGETISENVAFRHDPTTSIEPQDKKDITNCQNVSEPDYDEFITQRYPGFFVEVLNNQFTLIKPSESTAIAFYKQYMKDLNSHLSTIGFEVHISKKTSL